MGKNILRIYFVCVFQFEMMKPTRTRTQNIELTLYGLNWADNRPLVATSVDHHQGTR